MINPKIKSSGDQCWRNKAGCLHRENGPAIIYHDGSMEWLINGDNHRTDGPAVIWSDDIQEWYINTERYLNNKSFQKAAKLSDEDMTAIVLKYGNVTY
jgi:hypothetical protein